MTLDEEKLLKNNLAKNMRYLRLRGSPRISQKTLAKKLGTTQRSISRYEQALCLPPLQILADMAAYFSLSIAELLYGSLSQDEGKV